MPEWLRSLIHTVSTVSGDGAALVRLNAEMAVVETKLNLCNVLYTLGIAATALIFGSLFLLFASVTVFYTLVAFGFVPHMAAGAVTCGLLVITLVLGLIVRSRLATLSIVPRVALDTWHRNLAALKGQNNEH